MSSVKAALVEEIFDDLMDIGSGIDKNDEIIQWLREEYGKKGEGMSLVIEVTLKPATIRKPKPMILYSGCFTMVDGYPKKIPLPDNPHAKLRTDFMALRYIMRGWRHYKAPKGKIRRSYGFKKAWAEDRLHKEVRDDVHFLSDGALMDKVLELLEHKIFPIFRKRWANRWVMKDS